MRHLRTELPAHNDPRKVLAHMQIDPFRRRIEEPRGDLSLAADLCGAAAGRNYGRELALPNTGWSDPKLILRSSSSTTIALRVYAQPTCAFVEERTQPLRRLRVGNAALL